MEAWEKERERQAVEFCITSQTELPDFDKDSLLTSKASCRSSKKEHLENALNLMPDLHLVEDISSQHRFPVTLTHYKEVMNWLIHPCAVH